MSILKQAKYLLDNGEFIGDYHLFGCNKLLYTLEGKFYEITYFQNENVIEEIESKSIKYVAEFYSDSIDIGKL
jgi:hypothetical protein